jgi:hypothetical protein
MALYMSTSSYAWERKVTTVYLHLYCSLEFTDKPYCNVSYLGLRVFCGTFSIFCTSKYRYFLINL